MPETLQSPCPRPSTTPHRRRDPFPRQHPPVRRRTKSVPSSKKWTRKPSFEKSLIHEFFQLGLMGIEIPDNTGGGGAKFFEAILAVEELSRVDASSGVIVDVPNTLVNNALLRWGSPDPKESAISPRWPPKPSALTPSSEGRFRLRCLRPANPRRTQRYRLTSSTAASSGSPNAKESGLFVLFATLDPSAGTKAVTAFLIEKDFPGFTVGKKEDKLGHPRLSTCELILEIAASPKIMLSASPARLQDRHRNSQRRPHRHRRPDDRRRSRRMGVRCQICAGAQAIRQSHRRFPGHPVPRSPQMATEIEAARLMVYNAARMKDAGVNFVKEAAMTKLFASQVAERVTSLAIEIYGGLRLHQRLSRRKILARRQDRPKSTKAPPTCSWPPSQNCCSAGSNSHYGILAPAWGCYADNPPCS